MHASRALRGSVGLVAVLVLAASALTPPTRAHAAPAPTAAQTEEAKQATKDGLQAFQDERYDDAIEAFERAFALAHLPALLLNIGQAHRLNGSCRLAMDAYLRYQRLSPGSRHEDEVNAKIADMQRCLDAETARANGVTPSADPPAADGPAEENPLGVGAGGEDERDDRGAREQGRGRPDGTEVQFKPLTWGLIGAGVLGLGVGMVYGSRAREAARTVDSYLDTGGPWTADYARTEEQGKRDENIALYGLGLAVAAFGTVGILYYLGEATEKFTTTVAPAPTSDGAGASLVWSGRW